MNKKFIIVQKRGGGFENHLIIVNKKYSKKAVERNKIKKRIREILKELVKNNKEKYKLIVKKELKSFSYQELKEEISKKIY